MKPTDCPGTQAGSAGAVPVQSAIAAHLTRKLRSYSDKPEIPKDLQIALGDAADFIERLPPQEAVRRAIELLREWAEITRKGHTNPPAFTDWGDELHAKACHDEYLSIAYVLEHTFSRPQSRAEIIEECAKVIAPDYERGCDCKVCDCGNFGSAIRVARWDRDTAMAKSIRACLTIDPHK